jgi:hypothetical protein
VLLSPENHLARGGGRRRERNSEPGKRKEGRGGRREKGEGIRGGRRDRHMTKTGRERL